ncbi:hypothetical protein HPULCUR_006246 [Helicostylum pulchrum]|uniref:Uncharacterized protein n=1 Tax=Helicostylum pulchrum TaxID=562976 RepID=A0ABP9Y1C0_9FUNG
MKFIDVTDGDQWEEGEEGVEEQHELDNESIKQPDNVVESIHHAQPLPAPPPPPLPPTMMMYHQPPTRYPVNYGPPPPPPPPPPMQGYYDVYPPHPMYIAQAPTYAPIMPPPPHHLVSYGNTGSPVSHINTPIPNPNIYYHHHPSTVTSSIPLAKRPANLRVEIPSEPDNPNPSFGPPSALPSQFAQNLPSPSTFYPEFYQQNELPSPLNFSTTPISSGTSFHWPARGSLSGAGGGEYRPSPLAKL